MKTPMSAKTIFEIVFGIMLVAWVILLIPSPIHEWFITASIGGVPVDVLALAMSIMFTPPFILSTILRKHDVDYDDEVPAQVSHPDVAIPAPM